VPDSDVLIEAGPKFFLYASLLVVVGASALRWLLLPRASAELGSPTVRMIEVSSARLAFVASVFALISSLLRAWTHTVAAFGFTESSLDNIKLIAIQSRWGHEWRVQLLAALLLTIACAFTARWREAWPLATLSAILFAGTIPLLGHASGSILREALHIVHILAAATWLGTLVVVLAISIPEVEPDSNARISPHHIRLVILRNFSLIAMPSAAIAGAAGLVAAYLYVGAFSNLWMTDYGRTLVVKLALVGVIGGCGFVNWRRLQRIVPHETDSMALVFLETALSIAVVLVTALLTETGHPG
jgi:putative copper export protein